jgi:hypothetical protein
MRRFGRPIGSRKLLNTASARRCVFVINEVVAVRIACSAAARRGARRDTPGREPTLDQSASASR